MTALGSAIDFLRDFGFFDVIQPFLLVFSILFGILEKTKVFGVEEIDGKKYARKNINSMVSFVIAFFVIATKEIVTALQVSLPKVALVLTIVVCFMLLVGSFMAEGEFSFEKNKFWKGFLTIIMFLAVVVIFLDAFNWLDPIIGYVLSEKSTIVVPLLIFAGMIGTVFYIIGGSKPKSEEKKDK
ncbi:MAG: hypothetical protein V1906_03805 [Candidatus Woesearchaeota archaeon]